MKRNTKKSLQTYLDTQRAEYQRLMRRNHITRARRLKVYVNTQMALMGVKNAAPASGSNNSR